MPPGALLPSSSSAATGSGASRIGRCPAPGSTTLRTPAGSPARARHQPVVLRPPERDRNADLAELGEAPGAHRRVDLPRSPAPGHRRAPAVARHRAARCRDRRSSRQARSAGRAGFAPARGSTGSSAFATSCASPRLRASGSGHQSRRRDRESPSTRGPRARARARPSRRASCPRRARARRARARRGSPRPPRPARAASAGRTPFNTGGSPKPGQIERDHVALGGEPVESGQATAPAGRRRADAAVRAPAPEPRRSYAIPSAVFSRVIVLQGGKHAQLATRPSSAERSPRARNLGRPDGPHRAAPR